MMPDFTRNPIDNESVIRERRSQKERRKFRLSQFWFQPERRRRQIRRQSDRRRAWLLDYYNPILFYWAMLILVLSLVDAAMTLWLINIGAKEVNPVMCHLLEYGPVAFVMGKYLFTSFSLVIVVSLNYLWTQRLRFSMQLLLYCFAGIFSVVVLWQVVLLKAYAF